MRSHVSTPSGELVAMSISGVGLISDYGCGLRLTAAGSATSTSPPSSRLGRASGIGGEGVVSVLRDG
jgi:hypothetical protein